MEYLTMFPMDIAPKDGTVIFTYHSIWKVPMCIKWVDELNCWADSVVTVKWPEESFMGWNYCPEFNV
jgi:hypothetical protein